MMATTSFLSMWLSNTASTAMMLPIANAILKSLFGHRESCKDLSWESEETAGESAGRDWEQLHQGGGVGVGMIKQCRGGQGRCSY